MAFHTGLLSDLEGPGVSFTKIRSLETNIGEAIRAARSCDIRMAVEKALGAALDVESITRELIESSIGPEVTAEDLQAVMARQRALNTIRGRLPLELSEAFTGHCDISQAS